MKSSHKPHTPEIRKIVAEIAVVGAIGYVFCMAVWSMITDLVNAIGSIASWF